MIRLPRTYALTPTYDSISLNYEQMAKTVTTRYADIVDRKDFLAHTASIPTTSWYTLRGEEAALYRLKFSLITTTAGTGGTVTVTLGWNNGSAAQTFTSSSIALNTLGSEQSGQIVAYVAGGQTITYATTVAGAVGNPQYALRLRLEYLG